MLLFNSSSLSYLCVLSPDYSSSSRRRTAEQVRGLVGGRLPDVMQGTGLPAAASSIPWSSVRWAPSPASNHELVLALTIEVVVERGLRGLWDASHLGNGGVTCTACADQAVWATATRPARSRWTRAACGRRRNIYRCE